MTTTTTHQAAPPQPQPDPFDTLLTLEDQFYSEGYDQGMADGLAAGRAEGRQLGLERGFLKFVESGRLQGRAIVWASRAGMGTKGKMEVEMHITTLYALAETESLSTENNDEAVDDFDDRLRRAQGRFKVIERMVGEGDSGRPKGDGQGDDPGAGLSKREGVVDV
ncbi:hypothetical protein B0I37DRAFT_418683 [Chaetomium sp. MPI-CAGE-AT-0009]|nr:hypothetical protein B0I37DRAFT_418683 [Chaetomium sp. MPI-CAGE-AT-0009]